MKTRATINLKKYLVSVIAVFLLLAIIILLLPYDYCFILDMGCWENWSIYMFRNGFSNVYDSETNYPPFFLYMLYFFSLIQGSEESIQEHISLMKYIPLLFDFIPFVILYILYKKDYFKNNVHYYLLFNIAYFYNSVAWGQVDGIHSNLSLLSFLLAFRSPVAAVVVFVFALNTKMQSVIFLPVLCLALFTQVKNLRQLFHMSVAIVVTEVVITLPFILTGDFNDYLNIYLTSVDNQPKVSMNAFNLWHLVLWNKNPQEVYDHTTWLFFSYKQYGLAFFMISSFFSLLPFTVKSIIAFARKELPPKFYELLFLTAALVTFSFFYFNTQMHERYIHPALIFLFFYSAFANRFGLYVFVSIAYLLEMERVLQFLRMPSFVYDFILDKHFIAILFSVALVWAFKTLYSFHGIKNDLISLKKIFSTTHKADNVL